MKLVVMYRPDSEHSRSVEQYIREFKQLHPGITIDTLNVDSSEGIAKTELYSIMEYPAILAVTDDGSLLNSWAGQLPLMDDVFGAVMDA